MTKRRVLTQTREDKLVFVSSDLIDIKNHEYCIKRMLEELFPEGSSISVHLRDDCGPTIMTVMHCTGRGFIRAYKDREGRRRFARDFFYTGCKQYGE
jgi:hypothetical protein